MRYEFCAVPLSKIENKMRKVLLILLLAFTVIGMMNCSGGSGKEPPAGEYNDTLQLPLMTLMYDTADGWVYDKEDIDGDERFGRMVLHLEDSDGVACEVNVAVSNESEGSFRKGLARAGLDLRAYALDGKYERKQVDGYELVKVDGNRYHREYRGYDAKSQKALTLYLNITPNEPKIDKLLSGLHFNLKEVDSPKVTPWPWDGERVTTDDKSYMAGTATIKSQMIPFDEPEITVDIFNHDIAVAGDKLYLLDKKVLKVFDYDGKSLKNGRVVDSLNGYNFVDVMPDGTVVVSGFHESLIGIKDGAKVFSYDDMKYFALAPSGKWGVNYFDAKSCERCTFGSDGISREAMNIDFMDPTVYLRSLDITDQHMLVGGESKTTGGQALLIADHKGKLLKTLTDTGEDLGSVTFATETPNYFFALDGNMRNVMLWQKNGECVGAIDVSELFTSDVDWLCNGQRQPDGSILVVLACSRDDDSATEVVVFKLTGI